MPRFLNSGTNARANMNIVLTGGSGFVGRHLLTVLSSRGHRCKVLSRHPARCRELLLLPGVTVVRQDVFDRDRLADALQGADAVINLIGILNEKGRNGMGFLEDACRGR